MRDGWAVHWADMGRAKTISDDDVLRVARDVFRTQGHTATTREIAESAGISEAILYQRFGSKDELFFAAMQPQPPDIEDLLGPKEPAVDAQAYLRGAVVRLGEYFAEVIPLAVHVMTHPSFGPASLARGHPRGPAVLQDALAARLAALARRGDIAPRSETATARLLLTLAHDWALGHVLPRGKAPPRVRDLTEMFDLVWEGLRSRT